MSFLPRLQPMGDRAVLITFDERVSALGNQRARRFAARLRSWPVESVLTGYVTVLVRYDPMSTGWDEMCHRLERELADEALSAAGAATDGADYGPVAGEGRLVEIPVLYGGEDGPDLDDVAAHANLTPAEVVSRHAGAEYTVYCLGFSPGFAYLGGLEPALHTPRLPAPRRRVPVGSVGIGGEQTGIYPAETPGGWRLIGRTPLRLFDPRRAGQPALLQAGDRVRFRPIDRLEFQRLYEAAWGPGQGAEGAESAAMPPVTGTAPLARVLHPGPLTTVQDGGRFGYEAAGVPVAGPVDATALQIANWLVGNDALAPALECTGRGPDLEFLAPAVIAAAGADCEVRLNGVPFPLWESVAVHPGDHLTWGTAPQTGWRCYLAFAGGLAVPPVLGSASSDTLSGFGGIEGRPLRSGDTLRSAPAGAGRAGGGPANDPWLQAGRLLSPALRPEAAYPAPGTEVVVRAVPGPQADRFADESVEMFFSAAYRVSPQSNRMAILLDGPRLEHTAGADIPSEPLVDGAIQVPPDGRPVVLMANRQTLGGYTRIATVCSADLPLLAQCPPGAQVRFQRVSVEQAQQARRSHHAWLQAVERVLALRLLLQVEVTGRRYRLAVQTLDD